MGTDRHADDKARRRRNAAIALATLGAPFAAAAPAGADDGEGTKPPPGTGERPTSLPASHGNGATGAAVQGGEAPGASGSAGAAGSTGVQSSGFTGTTESTSAESNGSAGTHASTGAKANGSAGTHASTGAKANGSAGTHASTGAKANGSAGTHASTGAKGNGSPGAAVDGEGDGKARAPRPWLGRRHDASGGRRECPRQRGGVRGRLQ